MISRGPPVSGIAGTHIRELRESADGNLARADSLTLVRALLSKARRRAGPEPSSREQGRHKALDSAG
jgi:hypothetical protein